MTTHSRSTAKATLTAAFFALLAMTAVSSAQSDATLSGLVPSAGTLAPAFDSGTISYTASVPNATTDITVTPTATDPNATITVNTIPVASGSPSGAISLSVGANVITTVVVSQDTSSTITYTLTVTRTPNVDLSSLAPSAGTLIPAFASGTISYNAAVPTATTDITVTPTAVNPSATITVNGSPVTSGSPSGTIALSAGSNTITTVVTGEDLITTKTYTLTVTRGPKTLHSAGAKTWDSTTANWGLVAGGPYNTAIWSNSDGGDSAVLNANGNNGTSTVTLGETINLKALTFSNLRNSGPVQKYTITGSTLAFSSGGTITTGTSLDNVNNAEYAYINSAITGAPNVSLSWGGGNNTLVFAPGSGSSQAVGTVTGSGIVKLAGSTTGNTIVGLNSSSSGKIRLTSGTWTLTGTATGYEHWIEGGTLIISTGSLQNNNRATNLSGGTLHWNNAGAIRDNSISTLRDRDFNITGGSIDNTSGGAIISSHNPQMVWGGNWTFIGSNGANSNLNMGTGQVFLNGNRQVTVTNAAATLTVGGVIANIDTTARSLTKAGAGTLELRGVNTYTGATAVSGGTLKLGANNVLPNALTSTVSIGAATLDADTRTDTAGTLDVTGAATINLGVGAALAFADSETVDWTGGTLDITGTFVPGNDVDPGLGVNPGSIRFGTDNTGLNPSQLDAITVNGSGGPGTYTLDAFGYLKLSGGGPGPVHSFTISGISSPQTVGTPITGITITAKDASNATATSFTGTVNFGGTGGFTGTSASFTAGVLSGVSVTPTVAGSNLTLTVDDGASHTGSATITTIQTQYQFWAGGAAFDADANNDGVKNGMAFLLGAASPTSAVTAPTVTQSGGDLILNFNCLPDAARGNATLRVEHSSDLGVLDSWTATTNEVPDATNAVPDNDVTFVVGAGPVGPPALNSVEATIDSAAAAGNKLFGRLKAEEAP